MPFRSTFAGVDENKEEPELMVLLLESLEVSLSEVFESLRLEYLASDINDEAVAVAAIARIRVIMEA